MFEVDGKDDKVSYDSIIYTTCLHTYYIAGQVATYTWMSLTTLNLTYIELRKYALTFAHLFCLSKEIWVPKIVHVGFV